MSDFPDLPSMELAHRDDNETWDRYHAHAMNALRKTDGFVLVAWVNDELLTWTMSKRDLDDTGRMLKLAMIRSEIDLAGLDEDD